MDHLMPALDGLEAAFRVRQAADPPPVVLMVAFGERVPPAGPGTPLAAVVQKPVHRRMLASALASLLARGPLPPAAPAPAEPAAEATPPLRILLAEDNLVNQRVALKMLERFGQRADVASDGEQAVAATERTEYDLVLMDIQMPRVDGIEATRRILARRGRRPRIVAMTADAALGDRDRCLSAGMDDYLAKPVRLAQLAMVLKATPPRAPAAA
jgi:CheY-like chemotaxis protein